MFEIGKVHYNDVVPVIQSGQVIKKKRERAIFYAPGNIFIKIWVPNWTQGDITKFALDQGYYHQNNVTSLTALIFDETGERGYIQNGGETAEISPGDKSWEKFNDNVPIEQRYQFILDLFDCGLRVGGTYSDLAPSNIIFYQNKVNLIDLESFRSFDLIFERKCQPYEKFDLEAWWKPHETAKRDTDKFYRAYLTECLDINLDFSIDSVDNFQKARQIIKDQSL